MDSLLTVHRPQSTAAPCGEASGGLRYCRITWRHAVEKSRGCELHYGALAMRIYLSATCLVSVIEVHYYTVLGMQQSITNLIGQSLALPGS